MRLIVRKIRYLNQVAVVSKVLWYIHLQTFAPGYPPPRTEAHRGAARGACSDKQNMSPI